MFWVLKESPICGLYPTLLLFKWDRLLLAQWDFLSLSAPLHTIRIHPRGLRDNLEHIMGSMGRAARGRRGRAIVLHVYNSAHAALNTTLCSFKAL